MADLFAIILSAMEGWPGLELLFIPDLGVDANFGRSDNGGLDIILAALTSLLTGLVRGGGVLALPTGLLRAGLVRGVCPDGGEALFDLSLFSNRLFKLANEW